MGWDGGQWWGKRENTVWENGDNGDRRVRCVYRCGQEWTHSSYDCDILPRFHHLNLGFLMDSPSFGARDGAPLHMAKKEAVRLGWVSNSQSSKQLKLKVVKAGDVVLQLAGGGRAPGRFHAQDGQSATQLPLGGPCLIFSQRFRQKNWKPRPAGALGPMVCRCRVRPTPGQKILSFW